jgi:hypothetical protein
MKITLAQDGRTIVAAGSLGDIEVVNVPADFLTTFSLGKYYWDGTDIALEGGYKPPANWNQFVEDLPVDIALVITQNVMGSLLMARLLRLSSGETAWNGAGDKLVAMWNASGLALNESQVNALNALAVQCGLPLQLADGQLVVI